MNNFKQTEIGLIPDDWEIYKIKDVFSFTKCNASREKLHLIKNNIR